MSRSPIAPSAHGDASVGGSALPRRRLLQLAGLGALAAAVPGGRAVAQGASRPPARRKGQIVMGISQEPTVFNPVRPHIEVDDGVYFNIFSPLWLIDPKGDLVPQLAVEIPSKANGGISADGLTWRIRLRPGVTWHDGAPFTAEDVKFTLELINRPDFPAYSRSGHNLVRDIQVVSPTELTWRMERLYVPYLSVLATTFMVPRHILGAGGDPKDSPFNNKPVGTGPFRFVERRPGEHILLEANDRFFGEGPHVERVVIRYIPDLTVLKTQFQTGAIDYIGPQGISADNWEEAKAMPGRRVFKAPRAFIENIALNHERAPFKDPAVRRALYLAMDKATIIKDIYYGINSPAETYMPAESWAFNPDLPLHRYDPALARKVLDDAGWKPGQGGVREKDGVRLAFSNSTTTGNHLREQTQQFLQQGWRDIGADMSIRNFPPAVMWGDYWRKSQYDSTMTATAYMVGSDPDVRDRLSSKAIPNRTGNGLNTPGYENAEVDVLLEAGNVELDREKRKEIYRKVQAIVRRDLPILPMFQSTTIEGVKSGLVGYQANVNLRANFWNVNTWYWAT
ncbi:MAG: peptide ABC transporter substrate-binding protein [Alphaproteobacteria bacterium]|nr:peptide ABC transporter substrate-binding protein [Alphaproteobacteria bacterium]